MSELREATKVQLGDGKENGSQGRGVEVKTLGMEAEQSVVQGLHMASEEIVETQSYSLFFHLTALWRIGSCR